MPAYSSVSNALGTEIIKIIIYQLHAVHNDTSSCINNVKMTNSIIICVNNCCLLSLQPGAAGHTEWRISAGTADVSLSLTWTPSQLQMTLQLRANCIRSR